MQLRSPLQRLAQKAGAEAIGTFALVFVGCGAAVVNGATGELGHLGVSIAFGLIIMVMIYATGHLSGAHFNPAVTLAFAVSGRFPWRQVPAYLFAQCLAACAAAWTLDALLEVGVYGGMTKPSELVSTGGAVVVEVVLSFFLMFVITSVATDSRAVGNMAGLAIGGTVALAAAVGGPLTGASMNPARSIGPAIVAGDLGQLWIYLIAPPIGAVLGAFAYASVRCEERVDEPADAADAGGCC